MNTQITANAFPKETLGQRGATIRNDLLRVAAILAVLVGTGLALNLIAGEAGAIPDVSVEDWHGNVAQSGW